ncbi:hypothetical protein PVL29_026425 [Vitis rotundifolia]|uniref:Peroxidase n=1 Tax=Vitis rotundifolia TaxID=103349 RepID=A0AA38YMG1_VITRO|nr:hypothetical protein PVL29_026425 [Vitis rotundifolia]
MRWCFSFVFVLVLVVLHLDGLAKSGALATTLKKPKTASPKVSSPQDLLSFTHYLNTCPDVEGIIQNKVRAWVKKDYTLAASIIRLHFHDCAVRGCDASILLNHAGSERSAEASKTLRGFQVIEEIKAEVEKRCPGRVSCADILTAAARDATVLIGGPFWEVPFGRKDGKVSIAREANRVPQGQENVTDLIQFFQARGLTILDLPDPSLNATYLRVLKGKCGRMYNYVDLDGTTPRKFDTEYYKNLGKKMGLLSTDQELYRDSRTSPIVEALATQPELFTNQFAVSMVNLGNVQVVTGEKDGEIRGNCNFVNPN